ncbi:hypothetical protein G7Y79_00016g040390 [Physcia stellaris]|nr:hypothetical protein G7Y79_00016g040390 [Physcia stellaris]
MEAQIKTRLGEELHQACQDENLDAVRRYISQQQAVDQSYKPPLQEIMYTAAGSDNIEIAIYCLENGAAITDDLLKKLLICRAKAIYIACIDSKKVDINHYIPWYGDMLSNAATANDLEWAKLCLEHGADPNLNLYEEHKSILAAAAELASLEMVTLLVENKARVKGSGAIVMAAEEGKFEVVEYLLDRGADINEMGIEHPTDPRYKEDVGSALHRAVNAGHRDVVEYLIKQGASLNLKDEMGRTPLDLARTRKDESIEELLNGDGAVLT